MIILGIDPGLERIGFGVIEKQGSKLTPIDYGLVQTPRIAIHDRVRLAYDQLAELMDRHRPDALATERLLFSVNKTTAMDVAKVQGVVLLLASQRGLACREYSPPEIKQGVVGVGNADKKQVQFMVTRILALKETPKPDDVADALAIAITHALRGDFTRSPIG